MFNSKYAKEIWVRRYVVRIPDYLTLEKEYIKNRGVYVTSDKNINSMVSSSYTTVAIPIIRMVEYFSEGHNILIPKREDMVNIYTNIVKYLDEWRDFLKYSINSNIKNNEEIKTLLTSLDKFAREIHKRLNYKEIEGGKPSELSGKFGFITTFDKISIQERLSISPPPKYNSITELINSYKRKGRFDE
ncbi:MAG: hypothetical protein QW350_05820 [Candidatus Aenigmatarchaeota archaeon]